MLSKEGMTRVIHWHGAYKEEVERVLGICKDQGLQSTCQPLYFAFLDALSCLGVCVSFSAYTTDLYLPDSISLTYCNLFTNASGIEDGNVSKDIQVEKAIPV